jgi:uncharacterized protein
MAYLAPGVYVEEVESAVKPIAGVGTSTAAFIGAFDPRMVYAERPTPVDGQLDSFTLGEYPVSLAAGSFMVTVGGKDVTKKATLSNDTATGKTLLKLDPAPTAEVSITYLREKAYAPVVGERVGRGDGDTKVFALVRAAVSGDPHTVTVYLDGQPSTTATLQQGAKGPARLEFTAAPAAGVTISVDYRADLGLTASLIPRMCTSFGDFERSFGGFAADPGKTYLAHAVYGFFANGGTRCYVIRADTATDLELKIDAVLGALAAIDEVALVLAPGVTSPAVQQAITGHCTLLGDRFAILDCPEQVKDGGEFNSGKITLPQRSDYIAVYYPWLKVFDPATKQRNPMGDGLAVVPPSGHVAGVYARVDSQRGVHKAPANEAILGALGLRYLISRADQQDLNPRGVNCIRDLNGAVRVWGARTLSSDPAWTYISVRRLFLYLRESLDEGLQWTVFEPNDAALWAKIRRNVGAFLTRVWRDGALFGATPQEAFYVKCNAETNPPELRELGQVVTEIGVAVTRPAEFVIFRLSQWAGPQK